jgi:hypothetical protein
MILFINSVTWLYTGEISIINRERQDGRCLYGDHLSLDTKK